MWNKKKVINEIILMEKQGTPLNAIFCRDTKLDLFKASYRLFGSWNGALTCAAIDPEKIRLDRKTSSYKGLIFEGIVEKLFILSNIPYIRKPYISGCQPDFYDKLNDIWVDVKLRSWTIGIENTINKYLKHTNRLQIIYLGGGHRHYPDSRVDFISVYDKFPVISTFKPDNSISIMLDKLKKQDSKDKRFKTWSRTWTKEKIINEIRSLIALGKPINVAYLLQNHKRLYGAITKKLFFKNWAEAVSAAGYDPKIYSEKPLYTKWSKQKIICELIKLEKRKIPLNMWSLVKNNRALAKAIQKKRYYDDLNSAFKDANIDPNRYLKKWSKERIIFILQQIVKNNEPINAKYLYTQHSSVYAAICTKRYFPNWAEAVKAAGLDPYILSIKKAKRFKILMDNKHIG